MDGMLMYIIYASLNYSVVDISEGMAKNYIMLMYNSSQVNWWRNLKMWSTQIFFI